MRSILLEALGVLNTSFSFGEPFSSPQFQKLTRAKTVLKRIHKNTHSRKLNDVCKEHKIFMSKEVGMSHKLVYAFPS